MKKILFVCYGNICRSPMAEHLFNAVAAKNGLQKEVCAFSKATSTEEIGNGVYHAARAQLDKVSIDSSKKRAELLQKSDLNNFDLIIGMEKSNIASILRIFGCTTSDKVYRLLDFTENPRDIDDPWYTRKFQLCFDEISEGVYALFDFLRFKNITKI